MCARARAPCLILQGGGVFASVTIVLSKYLPPGDVVGFSLAPFAPESSSGAWYYALRFDSLDGTRPITPNSGHEACARMCPGDACLDRFYKVTCVTKSGTGAEPTGVYECVFDTAKQPYMMPVSRRRCNFASLSRSLPTRAYQGMSCLVLRVRWSWT